MRRKLIYADSLIILGIWLTLIALMGCTPGGDEVTVTRGTPTEVPSVSGWCEGGPEVILPDDVGCYLDSVDADSLDWIDPDTAVFFATPETIDNWPGAAVIYHRPSNSMLVFDVYGDVVPEKSVFNSRLGVVAFDDLSKDIERIASLKHDLQERWETASPEVPEIELRVAWQDQGSIVFMATISGLSPENNIFSCTGYEWIVAGFSTRSIPTNVGCENAADDPVEQFFFLFGFVEGNELQSAQLIMDNNLESNELLVKEGERGGETAVYQAVLNQISENQMYFQNETKAGFDDTVVETSDLIEPALLESYQAANSKAVSTRFLFFDNTSPFFEVRRYDEENQAYLPSDRSCENFHSRNPHIEGTVTFSQIGFNDDGSQALVHVFVECGTADFEAAYYILEKVGNDWQVEDTIPAAIEPPVLVPIFEYTGDAWGCGSIFAYQGNADHIEYIIVNVYPPGEGFLSGSVTFDLAEHPPGMYAAVQIFSDRVENLGEFPYCGDIAPFAQPSASYQAVSGIVTVTSDHEGPITNACLTPYQATIELKDIIFMVEGERVILPSLTFENVDVGWCAG